MALGAWVFLQKLGLPQAPEASFPGQGWIEPSLSSLQGHSSVVVLRCNQALALGRLVKIQISALSPKFDSQSLGWGLRIFTFTLVPR